VRIVFAASALNNSGTCTLAYSTEAIGVTQGAAAPAIDLNSVMQFPYFHAATINGSLEMRQIHLPLDPAELTLDDFSTTGAALYAGSGLDVVYLNVTGCPAGATMASVYVTTNLDYMPGPSALGLVKPQTSPIGPASIPCLSILVKLNPGIAQLPLESAKKLASFITSLESNQCSYVVDQVQTFLGNMTTGGKQGYSVKSNYNEADGWEAI